MNNEQKFQLCLEHAKQIVASYRAGAPEGCDPQASWIAVGVGVAGVGAGVASAATAKGDRFYSQAEASRKNIGAHLLYGAPAYAVARRVRAEKAYTGARGWRQEGRGAVLERVIKASEYSGADGLSRR